MTDVIIGHKETRTWRTLFEDWIYVAISQELPDARSFLEWTPRGLYTNDMSKRMFNSHQKTAN